MIYRGQTYRRPDGYVVEVTNVRREYIGVSPGRHKMIPPSFVRREELEGWMLVRNVEIRDGVIWTCEDRPEALARLNEWEGG